MSEVHELSRSLNFLYGDWENNLRKHMQPSGVNGYAGVSLAHAQFKISDVLFVNDLFYMN